MVNYASYMKSLLVNVTSGGNNVRKLETSSVVAFLCFFKPLFALFGHKHHIYIKVIYEGALYVLKRPSHFTYGYCCSILPPCLNIPCFEAKSSLD